MTGGAYPNHERIAPLNAGVICLVDDSVKRVLPACVSWDDAPSHLGWCGAGGAAKLSRNGPLRFRPGTGECS
jgi:hypothetical protein